MAGPFYIPKKYNDIIEVKIVVISGKEEWTGKRLKEAFLGTGNVLYVIWVVVT